MKPENVRTRGLVVSATALALVVLAAFGGPHLLVALPLSALFVAAILLMRRPRAWPWRLATAGAVLWTLEESAWFVERILHGSWAGWFTELTFYLGFLCWLLAVLTMPARHLPRSLVIAAVPAIGLLVWLLLLNPPAAVELTFPFAEALLVVASLPLLGGALARGASEGRVLVVLGFYLRALGAASLPWLEGSALSVWVLALWLLGYISLAFGVYLELDDQHPEFVPVVVAIASLQAVSAAFMVLLYRAGLVTEPFMLVLVALLAYVQLALVLVAVITGREAHRRADAELRAWTRLLEAAPGPGHEADALQRVSAAVLAHLPGVRGIALHGMAAIGSTDGYAYPLVAGGAEIGHLHLAQAPGPGSVIDTAATMLATRLQLAGDHDRWAAAALTDPLTGLLNRRGLEARAESLLKGTGGGTPFSVAMLDIDHFKRVNDVYGHAVGDSALKSLASTLRRQLRGADLAVRWGGEEFVVLLPDTSPQEALDIMRRVRHEVSATPVLPIAWPLLVSVGITGTVTDGTGDLSALLDTADAALLVAKGEGRNRIVWRPFEPARDA